MVSRKVELDWSEIEFRGGIEIHQQLHTRKLFCECKSLVRKEDPAITTLRKLHAVASELGEYDPAALHEAHRNRTFHYQSYLDSVCLVELDEEPPHPVNREALDIVMQVGLLLEARIVDEIQVMRKTVIDGSNTAGFQRTMLVATDGRIETSEGEVYLQYFCLEEDAARIIQSGERRVVYRLDRLGIPLLEIVTGPVFRSPHQAGEVTDKLGHIIRSLPVRRGIGSIRQDVNVSTKYGTRIEIKGVQRHRMIPRIMAWEAQRQVSLFRIGEELKQRRESPEPEELAKGTIDLTDSFRATSVEPIRRRTDEGQRVVGLRAPSMQGLLGREICPDKRLGTEMKDQVLTLGVRGIIHSDEDLETLGFSTREVTDVREACGVTDGDAFLLFAARPEVVPLALDKLYSRIPASWEGVPKESRRALADGNTQYMRPLPGEARMYPETDIPPVPTTSEALERNRAMLPEILERKLEALAELHRIPLPELRHIADHIDLFQYATEERGLDLTVTMTVLGSHLTDLRRTTGREPSPEEMRSLFDELAAGGLLREAVPDVLNRLVEGISLNEILADYRRRSVDLDAEIARVLAENADLLDNPNCHAIIMGILMEDLRGHVDGCSVARTLEEALTPTQ